MRSLLLFAEAMWQILLVVALYFGMGVVAAALLALPYPAGVLDAATRFIVMCITFAFAMRESMKRMERGVTLLAVLVNPSAAKYIETN